MLKKNEPARSAVPEKISFLYSASADFSLMHLSIEGISKKKMSQLNNRLTPSLRAEWKLFDQENSSSIEYLILCEKMISDSSGWASKIRIWADIAISWFNTTY